MTSKTEAIDFVDKRLEKNLPVSMLMHWNPALPDYDFHWMTITGLEKDAKTGAYIATVSTWGQPREIKFDDTWLGSTYTGLMYFQETEVCE